jgi:hypothetical protein
VIALVGDDLRQRLGCLHGGLRNEKANLLTEVARWAQAVGLYVRGQTGGGEPVDDNAAGNEIDQIEKWAESVGLHTYSTLDDFGYEQGKLGWGMSLVISGLAPGATA